MKNENKKRSLNCTVQQQQAIIRIRLIEERNALPLTIYQSNEGKAISAYAYYTVPRSGEWEWESDSAFTIMRTLNDTSTNHAESTRRQAEACAGTYHGCVHGLSTVLPTGAWGYMLLKQDRAILACFLRTPVLVIVNYRDRIIMTSAIVIVILIMQGKSLSPGKHTAVRGKSTQQKQAASRRGVAAS